MLLRLSPAVTEGEPRNPPESVRVIRTLGQGRAARAQLVEATMADGKVVTCVEKVFAPGLLTRTIYRLSFQAPFSYQSNIHAIRACFFRRRVAAAVLAASDIEASIAKPLYVRFDPQHKAWVLAAQWIDGRGIKPARADTSRISRWLNRSDADPCQDQQETEIDQLVSRMHQLEAMLGECGLVGSGWQVAPRALVSTANLLRTDDQYTIIDLESGIPAVLVPRYVWRGLRQATLPPFDDLDAGKLRKWMSANESLLTFRLGVARVESLRRDLELLIEHTSLWKNSEFAVFRRPWRHFTRTGAAAYQAECIRRWQQDGVVDEVTAQTLRCQPLKSRMIWWAGTLPRGIGRFASRMIGHRGYRAQVLELLRDSQAREAKWQDSIRHCQQRWVESERIPDTVQLSKGSLVVHRILQTTSPRAVHRFLVDPVKRRDWLVGLLLFLFSTRYQSWLGAERTTAAIDRWQVSQRIAPDEADELRQELCGHEVRAYTRGFGMHLALKAFAPVIVPAKIGGVAAFVAGGNLWFLLPMLWTPIMRTAVTMASMWTTRHRGIPHGEALAIGWLPFVGAVAFPLQMFSTRPKLSTFLIRDAAAKLGRRVPVYGGADSRTEIALIRMTDYLIESMQWVTNRLRFASHQNGTLPHPAAVSISAKTRLGRWLDRHASERIQRRELSAQVGVEEERIAA